MRMKGVFSAETVCFEGLARRGLQSGTKNQKSPSFEGLFVALATLTGLEPATSAVTGRRANQLRYRALLWCLSLG